MTWAVATRSSDNIMITTQIRFYLVTHIHMGHKTVIGGLELHFLAFTMENDWIANIFKNKSCLRGIFPVASDWVFETWKRKTERVESVVVKWDFLISRLQRKTGPCYSSASTSKAEKIYMSDFSPWDDDISSASWIKYHCLGDMLTDLLSSALPTKVWA